MRLGVAWARLWGRTDAARCRLGSAVVPYGSVSLGVGSASHRGRPPRKMHLPFKITFKTNSFWSFRVGGLFRVAGSPLEMRTWCLVIAAAYMRLPIKGIAKGIVKGIAKGLVKGIAKGSRHCRPVFFSLVF